MSKPKKGKKMDLAEFLGDKYADAKAGNLPRAPREYQDVPFEPRGRRRGDRMDEPRPRRDDSGEGRGDMDDQWRRREPARERGQSRDSRDMEKGDPDFGRSEEDTNWRRRGTKSGVETQEPGSADSQLGRSDADDNWRRGGPSVTSTNSSFRVGDPGDSEKDTSWRKSGPPTYPVDSFDTIERERPKLKLKKKSENSTTKVEENGEKKSEQKSENGDEVEQDDDSSGGDKWDRIFKSKPKIHDTRRIYGNNDRDMERENAFSSYSSRRRFDRDDRPSSFSRREQAFPSSFGSRRRDVREERDGYAASSNTSANRFSRESDSRFEEKSSFGDEKPKVSGPPRSLESLMKTKIRSWADDSEDIDKLDSSVGKPNLEGDRVVEKRELSKEDVDSRLEFILKDYFVMQQTKPVIEELKEKLGQTTYEEELVKKTIEKAYGQSKLEAKLAVKLFESLISAKILFNSHLETSFEQLCSNIQKSLEAEEEALRMTGEKNKQTLIQVVDLLKPKSFYESINFGELSRSLLQLKVDNSRTDGTEGTSEKVVDEILNAKEKGEYLMKFIEDMKEESWTTFGVKLLEKLYEDKDATSEAGAVSLFEKDVYGIVLHKLLYRESPKQNELQDMIKAIYVIQAAFEKAGFPKTSKNAALIEKVFISIYKNEILPDEAFIAWKDEISDAPGKTEAIVQTSKFLNFLEEDIESSEEDEED